MYRPLETNTARRLPIVFCLDLSPSMGSRIGRNSRSAIELLNSAVRDFILELRQDARTSTSAEIAFVTFSSEILDDTPFVSVASLEPPVYRPVERGGTQLALAVLRAVEKLETRRQQMINSEIGCYAPFLVLVTDGNPDRTGDPSLNDRAVAAVRSHCDSHVGADEIIVPFIIGVGDHIDPVTLNRYASGFADGYFPIRGNALHTGTDFRKVFQLIGNSTRMSVHLNGAPVVETIRSGYNELLASLNAE